MAPRRKLTMSAPSCSPRSSVDAPHQPIIDSILKELKICTRRLHTALASQEIELRILERLYYKGNHQHRTALFMRRVADVRRFGRRLEELRLHAMMDTVRLSFWGEESLRNSKVLKGPWTYVPDAKTVELVQRRLVDYRAFVDAMHDHLSKAYNHLNLDLQTGAFLQFILALTAVVSRMAFLLTEIRPALDQGWNACQKLLQVLDPDKVLPLLSISTRNGSTASGIDGVMPSAASTPLDIDMEEDIGSSIQVSGVGPSKSLTARTQVAVDSMPAESGATLDFMFANSEVISSSTSIIRTKVARTAHERPNSSNSVPTKHKTEKSKTINEVPKKKKKKRTDEIDDIFGF